MNITINRHYLLSVLAKVSRAIKSRSPMPVLTGVLLEAKDGCLVITGSCQELTIQDKVNETEDSALKVEAPGSIVIEAKVLTDLLKKMSSCKVKLFTVDSMMLRISSMEGNFDVVGFEGNEYPAIDLEKGSQHVSVSGRLLKDIYTQISYAAAEKDSRTALMGVNISMHNKQLKAAASDSYRAAFKKINVDSEEEFEINLPVNSFKEIIRCLDDNDLVELYINQKKSIQIHNNGMVIQSQLYSEKFPDLSKILKMPASISFEAKAEDLISSLSRTDIYAYESSDGKSCVPVTIRCEDNTMDFVINKSKIGSCKQSVEGIQKGENIELGINAKILRDALTALNPKDKALLRFENSLKPIHITDPNNESLQMIVTPMRFV